LNAVQAVTGSTGIVHQPKIPSLFGKDGKKKVSLSEFKKWFTALKKEVAMLEFQMLDFNDDGKISMQNFGKSIVAYGPHEYVLFVVVVFGFHFVCFVSSCTAAIIELKGEDDELSFDDFWSFQQTLERIDEINEAIHMFLVPSGTSTASRAHLKRAVFAVTGTHLSEPVVQTLAVLFNTNGRLDTQLMVATMHNKVSKGANASKAGLGSCLKNCWETEIVRRAVSKD
jgi:Ca2+-binding EF-hand superfamily protein